MDHYAPRKILQSSSDKPVLPQRCIARLELLLTGEDGDACLSASAAAPADGAAPAHSTAQASDIISHVTLIFESSRYVDCIRSASASALQYSFLPSFRLFLREHPTTIPSRHSLSLSLSLFLHLRLRPPVQTSLSERILYFASLVS